MGREGSQNLEARQLNETLSGSMNAVMYKTQEIVSARRVYILVGATSVPNTTFQEALDDFVLVQGFTLFESRVQFRGSSVRLQTWI